MFLSMIRGLVYASWILWLLVYWQGGSLVVADILQAINTPRTRLDAPLLITIALDTLAVLAACTLVAFRIVPVDPVLAVLSVAGAALALVGMVGTFYARQYLGPAWAAETRVESGQSLVDAGPYGYVRHPIYTAAMLMYAGLALVFPLWWNALAVLSILIGYVLKAQDEDRFLQESLGGYADYARRVRYRLVPLVW